MSTTNSFKQELAADANSNPFKTFGRLLQHVHWTLRMLCVLSLKHYKHFDTVFELENT